MFFANYKEIGANAAVDGLTDGDVGANRNAFTAAWNYMWADNCVLGITYITTKMHNAFNFLVPSSLDDHNIIKIDWNFRF